MNFRKKELNILKRNIIIFFFIILIIVFIMVIVCINTYKIDNHNNNFFGEYQSSLEKYKNQLNSMKKNFNVKNFLEKDDEEGIYFFGMENRRKMLYSNGEVIDYDTREVIAKFDYDEELIVPNEYSVILRKGDKMTRIYEDENGIFIDTTNEGVRVLDEGTSILNLPEFEEKKYSEILKVLHQEVLFNMRDGAPIPNLRAYNQVFYRDGVLGAMVLEKTGNVNLYLPWVESIDKIYDYAWGGEIKEVDSLGALLYLIGATRAERPDLVEMIIEEIDKIKSEYGGLAGAIHRTWQEYYPTALALQGAEKLRIDLNLTMPSKDDGYAKLTWYMDERIPTSNIAKSGYYPYLNWAFYHYDTSGTWNSGKFSELGNLEAPGDSKQQLYMLDEIYPLSYEAQEGQYTGRLENQCYISEFYCEHRTYLSHLWAASEMFLMLEEEA